MTGYLFKNNLIEFDGLTGSESSLYGEQRMWGSIGWGLFVVIAGALIDYSSKGQTQKDYTSSFILVAAILIIDLIVASQLKVIWKFCYYCQRYK